MIEIVVSRRAWRARHVREMREIFAPALESSRVRFVRDDKPRADHDGKKIEAPWIPVGSESDEALAARYGGGPLLVSPEFDVSVLREQGSDDELRLLLTGDYVLKTREENEARWRELIEQCPRRRPPPFDLDVRDASVPRANVLAKARELSAAAARRGLFLNWHESGGNGLHGDIDVPSDFAHPELLDILLVGAFLSIAHETTTDLLSKHRDKATRPDIVLDDTLFTRHASSRGVLWRPVGATKPKTGRQKRPINVEDGSYVDARATIPCTRAFIDDCLATWERQRELSGHFGKRTRRRGPVDPVKLPEGTVVLAHTARALARLATAAAGRHMVRLAVAGWLVGLNVDAQVVENTLAGSVGNAADARDAVNSTAQRIKAGLPVMGLSRLQDVLGGTAFLEVKRALVLDGVAKAAKSRWTDSDRSFLMRLHRAVDTDFPGRLALRDGARCQTFSMLAECEDHGASSAKLNVEERELTCPHCRERRIAAALEVMRDTWHAPNYHVLFVRPRPGAVDHMEELRAALRAGRALVARPRRYLVANEYVLFVFPADQLEPAFELGWWLKNPQEPPADHKREHAKWEAVHGFGIKSEDCRVVSKAEVFELVAAARRSPGLALQELVEARDEAGVLGFPWLNKKNVHRVGADKEGREHFPWPSAKSIRDRAKARAIAERGGIDPGLCDHETGIDDMGCPIPCMKPLLVHVDHLPTGVRLTEEPYVGRFPHKHELSLKLEVADPDVLRAGFELQRAIGRRR